MSHISEGERICNANDHEFGFIEFCLCCLCLSFFIASFSYDTAPNECLKSGYKGIAIHDFDLGFAVGDTCSDGEIVEKTNSYGTIERYYKTEDGLVNANSYYWVNLEINQHVEE